MAEQRTLGGRARVPSLFRWRARFRLTLVWKACVGSPQVDSDFLSPLDNDMRTSERRRSQRLIAARMAAFSGAAPPVECTLAT